MLKQGALGFGVVLAGEFAKQLVIEFFFFHDCDFPYEFMSE